MAKVLLLGGTGAIGVYLQDELVNLGHVVVVTSRINRESGAVRFVQGNAKNIAFLCKLLNEEHPDVIIDFMKYGTVEFPVFRDIFLKNAQQYVFLSSYRVFANEKPLVETSARLLETCDDLEYLMTDEYALFKAREEDALRNSKKQNWTIVRPSITYSKERFQFGCLEADTVCFRALRGLPVVIPQEMLDIQATLTWGKDVAVMISRLVLNPMAYGEDFNVSTSETHSWREIAAIYQDVLGMRVVEVSLDWYCQLCNRYQVYYDRMVNRIVDNRKVLAATGMSQTDLAPLSVALREELNRFKICPVYKQMNVLQNALMDRVCGSRIPMSDLSFRDRLRYFRIRYPVVNSMMSRLNFKLFA